MDQKSNAENTWIDHLLEKDTLVAPIANNHFTAGVLARIPTGKMVFLRRAGIQAAALVLGTVACYIASRFSGNVEWVAAASGPHELLTNLPEYYFEPGWPSFGAGLVVLLAVTAALTDVPEYPRRAQDRSNSR